MEQTFYAEAFEVGYFLFVNDISGDLTTASAGTYYVNNITVVVNDEGKIIQKNNHLTGENVIYKDTKHEFFGGDTFIGRFSLKRKFPFFRNNSFQLPDNTHINYSNVPNIAYPIYFFNTQENSEKDVYYKFTDSLGDPLNLSLITKPIKNLGGYFNNLLNTIKDQLLNPYQYLKPPNYNVDCTAIVDSSLFSFRPLKGVIYTYYYGIPYFLVESDVNLDLRDIEDKESQFFPKENIGGDWLQDKYIHSSIPEKFVYDRSYSKQSTEKVSLVTDPLFKGVGLVNREQRIIWSPESAELEENNVYDRYLIHKPLDYKDFGYKHGKLMGLNPIENNGLVVRFSNNLHIENIVMELETNLGQVNFTSGRLFKGKSVDFVESETGYLGSDLNCFISTPFGHIMVDPQRGQIFSIGSGGKGFKELTNQSNWFKENLPLKLKQYIPNLELNTLNYIGITLGFDQRFSTLYITKKDYIPLKAVEYRNNKFYIPNSNIEVSVLNTSYFKDVSWTTSYSFKKNDWISYHSFIPKGYISYNDHFDTIVSGAKTSIWKHNITNKSYLTYYGRTYPFIVDIQQSGKFNTEIVKDVQYFVDVLKYYNQYDYQTLNHRGFDHAVVYNKTQNSGLLEFVDEFNTNLSVISNLKYQVEDKSLILLRGKESKFRFNDFKNISKQEGLDWILSPNNVLKSINSKNMKYLDKSINNDYIRGLINNIRLISTETDLKVIFKGAYINGRLSNRG